MVGPVPWVSFDDATFWPFFDASEEVPINRSKSSSSLPPLTFQLSTVSFAPVTKTGSSARGAA
ncbi:MAG TPA: hypothetical protein PL182_12550, partial [Pseudobdellovibrionaceae bacterium]|nr:hypothetical protein [Pseudobdellovibrionaceae bacterium]